MSSAQTGLNKPNVVLLVLQKAHQLTLVALEACRDVCHLVLEGLLGHIVHILDLFVSLLEHVKRASCLLQGLLRHVPQKDSVAFPLLTRCYHGLGLHVGLLGPQPFLAARSVMIHAASGTINDSKRFSDIGLFATLRRDSGLHGHAD